MNKRTRNLILIASFLLIAFFIYSNLSNPNIFPDKNRQDDFVNIQELHWGHMPITYYFVEGDDTVRECRDYEIGRIRDAFNIIENLTDKVVTFREEVYGDILIYCLKATGEGEYMLEADAFPRIEGDIITNGTLRFYTHSNCGTWPDVEIHEILHLFGYNHIDDEWSIMNPIASRCDLGRIDEDIISCLKYTYSNGKIGDCSGECSEGTYPTLNGEYCCSEPNMTVDEEGYCTYSEDYEGCGEGWYLTIGGEGCCPKPNMYVTEDDYCAYDTALECPEGTYNTIHNDSCCPKPNMITDEEGNCPAGN